MPQLGVNGTQLHYQILGQPREGGAKRANPPAIMIHGLLIGNLASWYFSAASSLAKDREVLLYDLRGHGLSEKSPSGYDLKTMVSDLAAIIEERRYERVTLVGHSYGALVALHFALLFPGLVDKLVIVEAPLPPSKAAQMDAFMVQEPEGILEALPEHLREIVKAENRQARRFLERLQFLIFETELIANLKREGDLPDSALSLLRTPTLLVYAKQAQLADVGERLARVLPESRLKWLDGGHFLPSEKPAELTGLIQEFLA